MSGTSSFTSISRSRASRSVATKNLKADVVRAAGDSTVLFESPVEAAGGLLNPQSLFFSSLDSNPTDYTLTEKDSGKTIMNVNSPDVTVTLDTDITKGGYFNDITVGESFPPATVGNVLFNAGELAFSSFNIPRRITGIIYEAGTPMSVTTTTENLLFDMTNATPGDVVHIKLNRSSEAFIEGHSLNAGVFYLVPK